MWKQIQSRFLSNFGADEHLLGHMTSLEQHGRSRGGFGGWSHRCDDNSALIG